MVKKLLCEEVEGIKDHKFLKLYKKISKDGIFYTVEELMEDFDLSKKDAKKMNLLLKLQQKKKFKELEIDEEIDD